MTSVEDACAALRANAQAMLRRAALGELLTIDDLFAGGVTPPPDLEIFCLDGRLGGGDDALAAISPGLSFHWRRSGVDQFASGDRLKKSVRDFRWNRDDVQERALGESTYLFAPAGKDSEAIVAALSDGVQVLFKHSLNALNKYQDRIDELSRDLLVAFDQAGGRFGMLELAAFLDSQTGLDFGLLHLADSPTAPLGRAITVSTASSSKGTLRNLGRFLGLQPGAFLAGGPESGDPFPAVALPQTLAAELIVNAGVWGKPLASGVSADESLRLVIIPIARPFGPRAPAEEQAPLSAADLLFTFVDKLDRPLMDALKACVDTFSDNRYGARRFNLLMAAQEQHATSRDLGLDRSGPSPRAKTDSQRARLQQILNEVLYTTSAHSVTVRTYDAGARALVSAAAASGAIEGLSADGRVPDIPIRNHAHSSVVVFTFLNAGRGDTPYTYLRRISPPVVREANGKIKTLHRTFIPKEYKELGLQAPLLRRRMTRSEICFPLLKGRLAFGTFNLEAPYPAAFNQDIDYLTLVKGGIERLLGGGDEQVDGRWLITNAARSDAVHQLWQYQEGGDFFTPEQNRLLKMIFPTRSEHAPHGLKDLSTLRDRIRSWVSHRYQDSLRADVLRMIKFDHLSERKVDAYFLEAAFVVLRNLVQNSVKHGEPSEDQLFLDDRPWFGVRHPDCLRILYRSGQSVPPDIRELLGVAPIQQDESNRVAYGMYNVGLLSRLLGGMLHVTTHGETSCLAIEIHLPITEGKP